MNTETKPSVPAGPVQPEPKASMSAQHTVFHLPKGQAGTSRFFKTPDRFSRGQPRWNVDPGIANRAAREHARGRHSG